MAARLACNKFLVKEGETYIGLAMPETLKEAKAEKKRLGLTGEIITREDYEAGPGQIVKKRLEKTQKVLHKMEGVSILSCINLDALNDRGKRLLTASQRIDMLGQADEGVLDGYNPDTDTEI